MKAVVITKDNQQKLMARYGSTDLEEFPIGHILVTWFGDNGDFRYRGVLTEANFDARFIKGEALDNGFYSITKKQ